MMGSNQGKLDPDLTTALASPGTVQDQIDSVASNGGGVVELESGTTYTPQSTWVVREGVTLDFAGAKVVMDSNIDVMLVAPGGSVDQPHVDTRPVSGYDSVVFNFDTEDSRWPSETPRYYKVEYDTWVRRGYYQGTDGEGTLFYFHQNDNAHYVGEIDLFCHADGGDTVADFHSEGEGFINSVRIDGYYEDFRRYIYMRGPGDILANYFRMDIQPQAFGSDIADVFWEIAPDADRALTNIYEGMLWDINGFDDAVWYIGNGDRNRIRNQISFAWDSSYIQNPAGAKNCLYTVEPTGRKINAAAPGEDLFEARVNSSTGELYYRDMNGGKHTVSSDGGASSTPSYTDAESAPEGVVYYNETSTDVEYKESDETVLTLTESGTTDSTSDGSTSDGSTLVVDDFESGSLDAYSGDTHGFAAGSTAAYSGSYGLEADGKYDTLYSVSGLSNYPSAGDTIRGRVKFAENDCTTSFKFGYQSAGSDADTYELAMKSLGYRFDLGKSVDGSSTTLVGSDWDGSHGEWLTFEISWATDGSIAATLSDADGNTVASVSASDTTFTEGGIGIYNDGTVYWDDFELL